MEIVQQMNFKESMAAIYIRVSTDKVTQDDSYESQYEMIEREMKSRGFDLFKVYKERMTATKTVGRQEFETMLDDAQKGKFSAIFAKDLSRLARNQEVAHRFKRIVLENGVSVYTIGDGDNIEQNSRSLGLSL